MKENEKGYWFFVVYAWLFAVFAFQDMTIGRGLIGSVAFLFGALAVWVLYKNKKS